MNVDGPVVANLWLMNRRMIRVLTKWYGILGLLTAMAAQGIVSVVVLDHGAKSHVPRPLVSLVGGLTLAVVMTNLRRPPVRVTEPDVYWALLLEDGLRARAFALLTRRAFGFFIEGAPALAYWLARGRFEVLGLLVWAQCVAAVEYAGKWIWWRIAHETAHPQVLRAGVAAAGIAITTLLIRSGGIYSSHVSWVIVLFGLLAAVGAGRVVWLLADQWLLAAAESMALDRERTAIGRLAEPVVSRRSAKGSSSLEGDLAFLWVAALRSRVSGVRDLIGFGAMLALSVASALFLHGYWWVALGLFLAMSLVPPPRRQREATHLMYVCYSSRPLAALAARLPTSALRLAIVLVCATAPAEAIGHGAALPYTILCTLPCALMLSSCEGYACVTHSIAARAVPPVLLAAIVGSTIAANSALHPAWLGAVLSALSILLATGLVLVVSARTVEKRRSQLNPLAGITARGAGVGG